VSVGQKDISVFAAGASRRLGLPRGAICIVGSVVVRCRLLRELCLSALGRRCGSGFRRCGWLRVRSTVSAHWVFNADLAWAATRRPGPGYTSCDTPWSDHGREQLHGSVEVDETYVGGAEKGGKRGRGTENKQIVVIAVEVFHPKGFGRIRMRRIPDVSSDSLVPFTCEVVEPGSEILTDGWSGYNSLSEHNYTHTKSVLSESGDPAHVAMPGVHRIAALLKRWLLGIHQGAVSGKHLEYYLDEYTFRFNRRTSRSRGMLFYRLMQQAVATVSVPYRQLIDDNHKM
jgi:transposase-like protein